MEIRALTTYAGVDGKTWDAGDLITVTDEQAKQLIAGAYAKDPKAESKPKRTKASVKTDE